jgi:ribonuclease P/MRP protein subunit RPP1
MRYYDLHIRPLNSSIDDIIQRAKKLELTGITFIDEFENLEEFKKRKQELKSKSNDLDISVGVIINTEDTEELRKNIQKFRPYTELILVYGGDYKINRAASENPFVDIISHPEKGRIDSGLDHIVMKNMKENNVALEINFNEILNSFKKQRTRILSHIEKNIFLAKKYQVPVVTVSGSNSLWGLRSGRDLAAIPKLLGMDLSEAVETTTTIPERIVTENREKISGRNLYGVLVDKDEE